MTDRTTASLYGYVNPTDQDAGFVIPLFADTAGGNALLAQRIGASDRIRNFKEIEAPGPTVQVNVERVRTAGQSALWGFQFGDGTFAVDTRAALKKLLMDTRANYRDQPFLFLQIVQFCELASETTSALKAAYQYLMAHSRRSAEAWRDIVFLPTLGRQTLDSIIKPRPKHRVLDDVKFDVEGRKLSVMLPGRLFDQLQNSKKISSEFRNAMSEKAKALGITSLELNRVARAEPGLKQRLPEILASTIVIPIGKGGQSLIANIGTLPTASESRRILNRAHPLLFKPSRKLGGVTIANPELVKSVLQKRPSGFSVPSTEPVVMFVLGAAEIKRKASIDTMKVLAGFYRQIGCRVVVLFAYHELGGLKVLNEDLSRAMNQLRRQTDYWVFVRPPASRAERWHFTDDDYQSSVYSTVDLIHTCAHTGMSTELWTTAKRDPMKLAASSFMVSQIGEDLGWTAKKLVEQMMGAVSVERATSLIGLFERPRRSASRFTDTFFRLPSSFASELRFAHMDRPAQQVEKKKRSQLPSAALLIGVEFNAPPSKFSESCADILAKNGFKVSRPSKSNSDLRVSFEKRPVGIECYWSDRPPTRFSRDQVMATFGHNAIICNWPVPNELQVRGALEGTLCVSSVNIPTLAEAERAPGSTLLRLFHEMPVREFQIAFERNVEVFLTRALANNPSQYSLFQDLEDLSSATLIDNAVNCRVTSIQGQGDKVRIKGVMDLEVSLTYGKGSDDSHSSVFPGTFELEITTLGLRITDAQVDASSFYE